MMEKNTLTFLIPLENKLKAKRRANKQNMKRLQNDLATKLNWVVKIH